MVPPTSPTLELLTAPRAPVLPPSGSRPAGKLAVSPPGIKPPAFDPMATGARARFELALALVIGGGALVVGCLALASIPTLGTSTAIPLATLSALAVLFAVARLTRLTDEVQSAAWQRQRLERHLGRYVSPTVANVILQGEAQLATAERRDVTVLFCDLRDFTTMCERERPEEVVALLNAFYERACQVVQAHGGTVNKFMGDGLLALFGAPDDHPNPEQAAVGAAHEIMYAADELRSRGGVWSQLDIGISLDAGDVVVGEVGASSRAEYTAIGTTVNRAARLQGVAREAHRRIVLSGALVTRLGPRAAVVSMGSVKLKGLSEPVAVYAFRHS